MQERYFFVDFEFKLLLFLFVRNRKGKAEKVSRESYLVGKGKELSPPVLVESVASCSEMQQVVVGCYKLQ